MAITVTSKYKPFTYDELVKPLGEYWKKYDAQEEALNKSLEEVASLDAHLASLNPEVEGNREYINQVNSYKNQINTLAEELASEGYNAKQRKSATGLKQLYNSQIVPISNALIEIKKYAEKEREKENAGYVIGSGSVKDLTVADVIGGNIPDTTSVMSLKTLEEEAAAITTRITSAMLEYDGATRNQIKEGSHNGYTTTVGFDPRLLLTEGFGNNQKVKDTYQGIQNQVKKYILASLNLTEDEYNSLDLATKNKINSHIQQGIIRGVNYQQSITQKPTTSSRGGGSGPRSGSGALYIQYFPEAQKKEELNSLNKRLNDYITASNAVLSPAEREGGEWSVISVGHQKYDDDYPFNPETTIKNLAKTAFITDKKGSIPVVLRRHKGNDEWEDKTIYVDLPDKPSGTVYTPVFDPTLWDR